MFLLDHHGKSPRCGRVRGPIDGAGAKAGIIAASTFCRLSETQPK